MKIYKVVRLIPVGADKEQEVVAFYAANKIQDVIDHLKLDLMDQATEVLSIAYQAPLAWVMCVKNLAQPEAQA